MTLYSPLICPDFPCAQVRSDAFIVPQMEIDPQAVRLMMISEAAPAAAEDYYYAGPQALFTRTTLAAFQDAGILADSIDDLLAMGVYFTTAIKCGKAGYAVPYEAVAQCANLLKKEVLRFPAVKAYLLMGDVAIRTFNTVAKLLEEGRVIHAGSTYKIRGGKFTFRGSRVFPSYLQAGPSYFIEKSKREMIAQDIAAAVALL